MGYLVATNGGNLLDLAKGAIVGFANSFLSTGENMPAGGVWAIGAPTAKEINGGKSYQLSEEGSESFKDGVFLGTVIAPSPGGKGKVASGLLQDGLAYELKHVNKHLAGTKEAEKLIRKDGSAHVFTNKEALSKVEAAIFERGVYTGNVRGTERYGLMFNEPIGFRIGKDGSQIPLFYGELKMKDNLYHVFPRTGPAKN